MPEPDSLAMNNHRIDNELLDLKSTMQEIWKIMLLLRHSYANLEERVRILEGTNGTDQHPVGGEAAPGDRIPGD